MVSYLPCFRNSLLYHQPVKTLARKLPLIVVSKVDNGLAGSFPTSAWLRRDLLAA